MFRCNQEGTKLVVLVLTPYANIRLVNELTEGRRKELQLDLVGVNRGDVTNFSNHFDVCSPTAKLFFLLYNKYECFYITLDRYQPKSRETNSTCSHASFIHPLHGGLNN